MIPDDQLRAAIRHAALARETNVPAHPDEEQWMAYVSGQLDDAAAARARSHLVGCAECRDTVLDLSLLFAPSDSSGVLSEAQVDRISARALEAIPTPPERQRAIRRPAWLRMPAISAWVGAATVAAGAIVFSVNLSTRLDRSIAAESAARRELTARDRRISELERAQAADLSYSLVAAPATRSANAGNPAQTIRVLPEARTATLQIDVPAGSTFSHFAAALSSGGAEVWSSAELTASTVGGAGIVSVRVPAAVLTAGRFTFALYGINASGAREDIADRVFQVVR